jgi:polyphosphate kinase
MIEPIFFNRELSWLSFNYRVLQEAKDPRVPLYERIKFLAIYSSNLDEFFRVRVASLRSLLRLKQKSQDELKFDPKELLNDIHSTVYEQQEEFGKIYREQIIPELKQNNVYIVSETELSDAHKNFVEEYFQDNVVKHVQPILLVKNKIKPFLLNRHLYLAVKLASKVSSDEKKKRRYSYAIVEIPTSKLPRFIRLPKVDDNYYVMFIDDIIRYNLPNLFNAFDIVDTYSIKLNRDADLYIEDEFNGNLQQKIEKGLKKRDTGVPSRFLYDKSMPKRFLNFIKDSLDLEDDDLVPGGRYHNYYDFFSFPNPGLKMLEYEKLSHIPHKTFDNRDNYFDLIAEKDQSLHFPYHSYKYVINFLEQAANDEKVSSIKVTQYRVASDSAIVKALIKAAKNGKEVMAFVELKARFDEEANIHWAEEMEKAGVKVFYSFPGLKVHAKMALIERIENDVPKRYCYLSTGNFNEKTAKIYGDFGLFTNHGQLTIEAYVVFNYLARQEVDYKFKHLLVAQFNMRKKFSKLVEQEMENAINGKEAKITLKMNSLEDKKMIKKLYSASQAGVKIRIIVRGVCCLVPGVKGLSENIKVISIVDRFLEHARFYMFHNDGDELIYAASADWMKRNLSRRVEVAFPIYDDVIRDEVKKIIDLQIHDDAKARVIDKKDRNKYKANEERQLVGSQLATYDFLKTKAE